MPDGNALAAVEALRLERGGTIEASPPDPMLPAWLPVAATALAPVALVLFLGVLVVAWIKANFVDPGEPAYEGVRFGTRATPALSDLVRVERNTYGLDVGTSACRAHID